MDRRFTDIPLGRSLSIGTVAFALGYALTYLLIGRSAMSVFETAVISRATTDPYTLASVFATPPAAWKATGWLFYSAHLSLLQVPTPGRRYMLFNPVLAADGSVWLLCLIPLLLSVFAGFLAVGRSDATTLWGVMFTGMAISLGYFPLATVGSFALFQRTPAGPVTVDLLWGMFYVGFVYPATGGTIGGFLANSARKHGLDVPLIDRRTADS